MSVHPTAIISAEASLAEGVEVGPYAIIEGQVKIGRNTKIGPMSRVCEFTEIGSECEIHQGCVIGGVPQDQKFAGEMTQTIVGDRNIIREYVTVNRGTECGGGKTVIGNDNLILCYTHIGHDCIIGNHIILVAYTALTGHVTIDDYAATSGKVGIHHFCRVGQMAYIGGMSKVTQDIPPYIMADGNPCRYRGLNLVGLRRNHLSAGAIAALKEAYRVLFVNKEGNMSEVIERFKESEEHSFPEVQNLVRFIEERSLNRNARYLENFRGSGS